MLIIWRGLGIVIPGIILGFVGLAHTMAEAGFGEKYLEKGTWPMAVALLAAGVTTFLLGRWFEKRRRQVEVDHKAAGWLPVRNDLFFINFVWWGLIITVVSILMLVAPLMGPGSVLAR